MPRKRVIREPCECIDCREVYPADNFVGTSVAQQQPPPKCLVFFVPSCCETGNHELQALNRSLDLPHVTAAVQAGCSGILAIRPDAEYSDAVNNSVVLRNLFCQVPVDKQPEAKGAEVRGSALRNLKAEFAATGIDLQPVALEAGFTDFHDLSQLFISRDAEGSNQEAMESCADILASRLGLPKAVEASGTGTSAAIAGEDHSDLLFCHLSSWQAESSHPSTESESQTLPGDGASADKQCLLVIDGILKALNARPGFQETVLLVLLLGLTDPHGCLPFPHHSHARGVGCWKYVEWAALSQDLKLQGYEGISPPRQSYEFACLDEVAVDRQHAILCVQRLPYVVRKDGVKQLPESLEGFKPGNACILAERLFPEIAYKLGHAPKYGA